VFKDILCLHFTKLDERSNDSFFGAFGVTLAAIDCRVVNFANGGLHPVESCRFKFAMDNDSGGKIPVSSQNQESDSSIKYTIPGILHFIQHEWARFEMDRAHWDVEKAELQVIYIIYCHFRSL